MLCAVHEMDAKVVEVAARLNRAEDRHGAEAATQRDNLAKVEERVNNVQVNIREIHEKINKVILSLYHGHLGKPQKKLFFYSGLATKWGGGGGKGLAPQEKRLFFNF